MTRILIVDDELVCRESLGALLSLQGFEVRTAADGSEATELGKIFPPDVLVVDRMLGGSVEGPEVAKILRSANPNMRVVMVTGFASADFVARMKDEPLTLLLVKPVVAEELLEAVQDADLQRQ